MFVKIEANLGQETLWVEGDKQVRKVTSRSPSFVSFVSLSPVFCGFPVRRTGEVTCRSRLCGSPLVSGLPSGEEPPKRVRIAGVG